MRTLKAFWHWVDHEKPDWRQAKHKAADTLSPEAGTAVDQALAIALAHTGANGLDDEGNTWVVRDISLALMPLMPKLKWIDVPPPEPDVVGIGLGECDGCTNVGAPRPAPAEGLEVDEVCNRNGCQGTIEARDLDGCCLCHISPPCSYCTTDPAYCPECDWQASYWEPGQP